MVTVLVADNDPGVRSLLVEVVRRQGCAVEGAIDGVAARERLEAGGIDILVCDLDMPRLSGNDLLAWIEARAVRPLVVVVSGYIDGKLEAALGSLRCVRSVLRKPFDVFAFAQLVRGLAAAAAANAAPPLVAGGAADATTAGPAAVPAVGPEAAISLPVSPSSRSAGDAAAAPETPPPRPAAAGETPTAAGAAE